MSFRQFLLSASLVLVACVPPDPNPFDGGMSNQGGGTAGGNGGGSGGGNESGDGGMPNGAPTYYKDVLPITQVACNGCHVARGIAPFALDSYTAARTRSLSMAAAVTERRMPPWIASPTCGGPFIGDRSLTATEIATISQWAQAGAPEGNPADAPAPVGPPEQLPKVDLTKQMPNPYTPTLRDDYRCFVIDPQLSVQQVITGYDIVPGSRTTVHHVIMYVTSRTDAVAKDAQDARTGWSCFGDSGLPSTGALGAWAPGSSAVLFPAGTGIRLGPTQVLAMQVHYNTDQGVEPDQTSVKLMYGTGTEREGSMIALAATNFRIPPNALGYSYFQDFPNPTVPLKLWGFLPHMHTKGKTIKITAGANQDCLVDIPRWDFHWQYQYFRTTPYTVPSGSSLRLSCSWDNPTSSTITWGEGTSDEMCFAFVYATRQ